MSGSDNSTNTTTTTTAAHHDWEYSKENAAPLECGRSVKTLSKRAFGTSTVEMAQIEEKTKKYERLVRRSEKAVEWLQKQSTKILVASLSSSSSSDTANKYDASADGENETPNNSRELTEEESQSLRQQLVTELGYDPSTSDRDNIDYDPMRYWVLYIKHIREAYPTDTQKQFLLMERCARTFMARPFLIPSYQNDVRFIRICILYADKTSNPSEVFKLMSKSKVGTKVSLFWVAWAWVAEKAQDFPFTEKIFQKALSVGAEPRQFLEERQRQFLRRMSRHWLDASQMQEDGLVGDGEDNAVDCAGKRGVLNSLSSEGVARNDRGSGLNRHAQLPSQPNGSSSSSSSRPTSARSSNSQLGGKSNSKSMAGFNIFQDGNAIGDTDVLNDENNLTVGQTRLTKESERTKENNMRPELWNERGYGLLPPSTTTTATSSDSIVGTARESASLLFGRPPPMGAYTRSCSTAAFEVFVDDDLKEPENEHDVSKENSGRITDQRSLRHRVDGGAADRLTRDPLRYMKNPSKVISDQIKYDANPEEQCAATTASSDRVEHKKQVADEERTKDAGSDKEHCFEELRLHAHYYTLASSDANFNLLKQDDNDQSDSSSRMDVEESMMVDESCSEMDTEDDTKVIIKQPNKSALKSSLKQRHFVNSSGTKDEEVGAVANPHRVLFGATTNVVYTNNASVDTSTASSQFNGSFVKVEETINTKLANAEISMMFSSPNANASIATTDDDGCLLKGLDFSIYQDDANKSVDSEKCEKDSIMYSVTNGLSFAIHNDDKHESSGGKVQPGAHANSGEDTASLSIIGNVLDGLECEGKSAPVGYKRNTNSRSAVKQSASRTKEDRPREKQSKELETATEETADFALIQGVMGSLNSSVAKPPRSSSSKLAKENLFRLASSKPASIEDVNSSSRILGAGFEIFSDENATPQPKRNAVPDLSFGDISRIEDEKTSNFQILDENVDMISSSKKCDVIVYERRHKQDMESAMRECMAEAAASRSQFTIFDNRKKSMPKALLRQSFTAGTKIVLSGRDTVIISNELGRGVYGVVLLCKDETGESDALKVQAPIGSLAHEYSILLRIEDRMELNASDFYPFPRSLALYAYSEGGLFSMTAGSDSGMTLIDVVNTYKKITGNVPELLAMYYTSRMLKHLELLHRYGKVLHCDIKPDNWVLTSSSTDDSVSNSVGGADLMLVDFGRSIDLSYAAVPGSDPLETQFTGSIAAEDMECGSMRDGTSWGIELDLFGLAASSYILLFGSHMEVMKDRSSGKWRPNKPFRRYWQQELWGPLFDSLLNHDSKSADEYCLRDHMIAFAEYIEGKQRKKEIATHLNQLYTHLPRRR